MVSGAGLLALWSVDAANADALICNFYGIAADDAGGARGVGVCRVGNAEQGVVMNLKIGRHEALDSIGSHTDGYSLSPLTERVFSRI